MDLDGRRLLALVYLSEGARLGIGVLAAVLLVIAVGPAST